MSVMTVYCTACHSPVRRLGPPTGQVLCRTCLNSDSDDMLRESVRAAAADRLAQRLARFDRLGMFDDATLPAEPRTRWQTIAIGLVAEHCRRLGDGATGRCGLMFIGPTGIGKTRAAIAIARAVGTVDPAGVAAVTESELLDPGVAPWELPAHIARLMANRHTLLVDEIGSVARQPDHVMAGWRDVAEHIHASDVPVLFVGTTNRQSWSERGGLGEWMGAQAVSRLRQFCETATTGWTDHRIGQEHLQWKHALNGGAAPE